MVPRGQKNAATAIVPVDALILCGGLGTRLRPAVPDRPKALATISGRPFLDILVEELVRGGFSRLILCSGYGSDQLVDHFRGRADAEFVFSTESSPLGTGGAVRNALSSARSDPLVVLNGDSFCRVSYSALLAFHSELSALATVVVAPAAERTDVGVVQFAPDGLILSFDEKPLAMRAQTQFVNAGIYVLQRRLIESEARRLPFSLEREVLPDAVAKRGCYGFPVKGPLVDIGTPDRYRAAQGLFG